jgi:hypothetical protein
MLRRLALPFVLASPLASLGPAAHGQAVGSQLPELELTDLSQSKASSMEDFTGRALLLEFFAHW